jgi:WD40 repeat protein
MTGSKHRSCLPWWIGVVVALALPAYGRGEWGIAFSGDSARVAVYGGSVRVYAVASGDLVAEFKDNPVRSLAFSPKTRELLATGGTDGVVRLWDVGAKQGVREFQGLDGEVQSVAFSPDGRHLAGTTKGRLRLWEVATGKVVQSVDDKGAVAGVSFSGDGRRVAFCRNLDKQASRVDVYDVAPWKPVAELRLAADKQENGPNGKATAFGLATTFTPDGKRVLVAGGICVPVSKAEAAPYDSGCVTTGLLWSAALDGKEAKLLLEPRNGYLRNISVSPDGKRFVTGANLPAVLERVIEVREVGTGQVVWQARGGPASPSFFPFVISPDGKLVGAYRSGVDLWNADTGELVRTITVRR